MVYTSNFFNKISHSNPNRIYSPYRLFKQNDDLADRPFGSQLIQHNPEFLPYISEFLLNSHRSVETNWTVGKPFVSSDNRRPRHVHNKLRHGGNWSVLRTFLYVVDTKRILRIFSLLFLMSPLASTLARLSGVRFSGFLCVGVGIPPDNGISCFWAYDDTILDHVSLRSPGSITTGCKP